MGWRQSKLVDQRRQIIGILNHAALPRRPLAPAVTTPIVRQNREFPAQRGHDWLPVLMVAPGTMHKHQRITLTTQLVVQLNLVHTHSRRDALPFLASRPRVGSPVCSFQSPGRSLTRQNPNPSTLDNLLGVTKAVPGAAHRRAPSATDKPYSKPTSPASQAGNTSTPK